MASSYLTTTTDCAAPAHAGAGAHGAPSDTMYCCECGGECGTVIDAGFDPRLHGMAVRHAACAGQMEEGGRQ